MGDDDMDFWERMGLLDAAIEDVDPPDIFLMLSLAAGRILACIEPGRDRNRARRDFHAMLRDAEKQSVIAACDA